MQSIDYILQKYWGYTAFRPLQKEVIEAVLAKKDVLALMPTGGGKSICFQVPTMLQKGLCLVISPLVALMQDQVRQLKERGIAAVCIFSGMDKGQIEVALDNCVYGDVKFLYVSPERLETELFLVRLQKMRVCLLVVDEAHCISMWGEDFRPAYRRIARIKPLLPGVNTLALTATATLQVKKDIALQLRLHDAKVFQKSFVRENLAYVVREVSDIFDQLVHLLRGVAGSALVYTGRRASTKAIADLLHKKDISATYYHAGLEAGLRIKHQKVWMENAKRVMVATNAFGMGIDKPDVRMVVHVDLPASLEAYYQEAGRAGRDGQKAYAVVLYDSDSVETLQESIHHAYPSVQKIKQVYQCLANYYQVAIGSHQMIAYEFDLEDFVSIYQLAPTSTRQAIGRLEEEGLIQYTDQFFNPAKVYITALPRVLYAFQVAHKQHDRVIQALVHAYGDRLFRDFCAISLKRLAGLLQCSIEDLDKQLKCLQALVILHYIPQKDYAQITFTTPRYAQENLLLSVKKLDQRKGQALAKAEGVLHYIRHKHRCRTLLLVEYFGQVTYERCKVCDICLAQREYAGDKDADLQHYQKRVLEQVKRGHHSVYHIIQAIDPQQSGLLSEVMRQMINKGELVYDETLRLVRL